MIGSRHWPSNENVVHVVNVVKYVVVQKSMIRYWTQIIPYLSQDYNSYKYFFVISCRLVMLYNQMIYQCKLLYEIKNDFFSYISKKEAQI